MGSRQENRLQLKKRLADSRSSDELASFLLAESRLPGPRANLELAGDLAQVVYELRDTSGLRSLFRTWLNANERDQPAAGYLPFCALHGLGGLYLGAPLVDQEEISKLLRQSANSEKWRLREAVTLGLQFIGERNPEAMMAVLRGWSPDATLLEERAIVCTIAHPPILAAHLNIAVEGLGSADEALHRVHETPPLERGQEPFKVLAKGLAFAVSVIVAAAPEHGFGLMRRWVGVDDADIDKILKENLKKDRLAKRFAVQTAEVATLIDADTR
jgi:hypothetical protein